MSNLSISYAKDHVRAEATGTLYSVEMINQSADDDWIFYVYQKLPNQSADMFSVAWFASPFVVMRDTSIVFSWEIDYNFVWSKTGELTPGVRFLASATKGAYPNGVNATTFSLAPGPHLREPVKETPSGSLIIHDAGDVPNNQYSVGIGMSGEGTFVVQAGTNLTHTFTPTPSYWIAAGKHQQIGTVLDIQTITQTAELKYEPASYKLKAILNQSNTWDIANP